MKRPIDFLVRPLGALYFGPPRSFDAGVAHHGSTLFPPPQSAFQGMIRSQLLREAGVDLLHETDRIAALVGAPGRLPDGWQIQGPLPARVVDDEGGEHLEPWVPAPAFLLRQTGHSTGTRLIAARPLKTGLPDTLASISGLPVGVPRTPRARPAGGWLSAPGMVEVLSGRSLEEDLACKHWRRELPPFVEYEEQPGLALETARHGVARHGMLYFLRKVRFQQASRGRVSGFWGRLEIDKKPSDLPASPLRDSVGAAGRKSQSVAFEPAPEPVAAWRSMVAGHHLPDEVMEEERFWLVSCTPVPLEDPRKPVNPRKLPPGIEVEVEAVLSGRPRVEGGMHYTPRGVQIRPTRQLLPAGTAWLFKLSGGDPLRRAEALRMLHDGHPLGDPVDAAFGHGYSLVGLLPTDDEDER